MSASVRGRCIWSEFGRRPSNSREKYRAPLSNPFLNAATYHDSSIIREFFSKRGAHGSSDHLWCAWPLILLGSRNVWDPSKASQLISGCCTCLKLTLKLTKVKWGNSFQEAFLSWSGFHNASTNHNFLVLGSFFVLYGRFCIDWNQLLF